MTNDDVQAFKNYDDWKTSPPETPEPDEKVVCSECLDPITTAQYDKTSGLFPELRTAREEFDSDENVFYAYGLCPDCESELRMDHVAQAFKKIFE